MNDIESKRGRPLKNDKGLNKELIIDKAKYMMLNSGKIPSIRAISKELMVDPMALYYYFKNKNLLLEEITKSLISDIYEPSQSSNWQLELSRLSKSYLTILYQYEGLLHILLSMTSIGPAEVFINRFNSIMRPLNIGERQEKLFLDVLVDYLHGVSIALACDKSNSLTIDYVDQPLEFLIRGIKFSENKND